MNACWWVLIPNYGFQLDKRKHIVWTNEKRFLLSQSHVFNGGTWSFTSGVKAKDLKKALLKGVTLPKTNSSHLKMDGWKISFWDGPFSVPNMLVSGRKKLFFRYVDSSLVEKQVLVESMLASSTPLRILDLHGSRRSPDAKNSQAKLNLHQYFG